MQVWLIPIADEGVGAQVKLRDPLRTRVIPERASEVMIHEEALYQVYVPLPFTTFSFCLSGLLLWRPLQV